MLIFLLQSFMWETSICPGFGNAALSKTLREKAKAGAQECAY